MKYFIEQNGNKKGPLTFEEIKLYNIHRDTLVWKEGLQEWTIAEKLEEFNEYLKGEPPSSPKNTHSKIDYNYSKLIEREFKAILLLVIMAGIIAFISYGILYSINKPPDAKTAFLNKSYYTINHMILESSLSFSFQFRSDTAKGDRFSSFGADPYAKSGVDPASTQGAPADNSVGSKRQLDELIKRAGVPTTNPQTNSTSQASDLNSLTNKFGIRTSNIQSGPAAIAGGSTGIGESKYDYNLTPQDLLNLNEIRNERFHGDILSQSEMVFIIALIVLIGMRYILLSKGILFPENLL